MRTSLRLKSNVYGCEAGLQRRCGSELRGRVFFNEPLSRHTTFNIGGPAKFFIIPLDVDDLKKILSLSSRYSIPYYILGNGSNLLVSDRGVDGIVIKLNGPFSDFNFRKDILMGWAGADLSVLRREACKRGLSGLEFTAGIPGTLGGAVVMNAGAGTSDMGGLIRRVEIMDKKGRIKWFSLRENRREIDFGYRHTSIKNGSIVLRVELKLKPASPSSIRKRIREIWERRKRTQPVKEKSAGSVFKNPTKFPRSDGERSGAGFLIDRAGLKGKSCGRAYISPVHANFIINRGGARAKDVLGLIEKTKKEVFSKFGIRLEPEIEIW